MMRTLSCLTAAVMLASPLAPCRRPRELARDKGLANSAEAFDAYCAGEGR